MSSRLPRFPLLEHNARVLREVLGYDAEKIRQLEAAGALG